MGNATSASSYIDNMIKNRQSTLNSAMLTCVSQNKTNVDLSQVIRGVTCAGGIKQEMTGVSITADTKLVGQCDQKSSQVGQASSSQTQSAEQTANAVSQSLQLTAGSDTTASNIFKGTMDLDQEIKNQSNLRLDNMNDFALNMKQLIEDSYAGKVCEQEMKDLKLDTKMKSELDGFQQAMANSAITSDLKSSISQKASAKQSAAAMYAAAAIVVAICAAIAIPAAVAGKTAIKYIAIGAVVLVIIAAVVGLIIWTESAKQYFNVIDVTGDKLVKMTQIGSTIQPSSPVVTDGQPLKFRLDASTGDGKLYVVDKDGKEVKLNGLFTITRNQPDTDSHDKELPAIYLSEWLTGKRRMLHKDDEGKVGLGEEKKEGEQDPAKDRVLGVQRVDKEDKFGFLGGVKTETLLGGLGGVLALVIVIGLAISSMTRGSSAPAAVAAPTTQA